MSLGPSRDDCNKYILEAMGHKSSHNLNEPIGISDSGSATWSNIPVCEVSKKNMITSYLISSCYLITCFWKMLSVDNMFSVDNMLSAVSMLSANKIMLSDNFIHCKYSFKVVNATTDQHASSAYLWWSGNFCIKM
jgi:hypothetical protein